MKPMFLGFMLLGMSMFVSSPPSFAHHGFQYEFDGSKEILTTGVLQTVEWENPHIYFNIDVKDANGKVTSWRFEGSSASLVTRSGTSRDDLMANIGKVVTVRGAPAKDGSPKCAAEVLKQADGRELVVGRARVFEKDAPPSKDQ